MSSPKRVYVRCWGRLANQLISWANARYAIRDLPDRILVMVYRPLQISCTMPQTEFQDVMPEWEPRVGKDLATAEGDCIMEDAFLCAAPYSDGMRYLREIQFNPELVSQVESFVAGNKLIGVHIRYGDYQFVDPSNPPEKPPPFIRAPNDYYLDAASACCSFLKSHKVFLSTDGTLEEVSWFTERFQPIRQPTNDGVLDFLTLARCKIIVGSASTFSPMAAAFRSVPVIQPGMHPKDVEFRIKSVAQ